MSTEPNCICINKSKQVSPESWVYPEWTEGGSNNIDLFKRNGYFVVRELISPKEIEDTSHAISGIVQKWYHQMKNGQESEEKDWEEMANRLPELQGSDVKDDELEIRRLFRMVLHDEFFAQFCRHPRIVSMVTELLGPDIKLVQSMSLLKPPGSGQKKWHQDNAYFRLSPSRLLGVWIALDPANCANGCMHVLPSSHGTGVFPHAAPAENHIDYSMVTLPNPDDVVPVILNPGDALVFHGETAHYTPPNVSNTRRRSVQFHYGSSFCKPTKCPRQEGESHTDPTLLPQSPDKPHYFDCDPNCREAEYWYYRKAELLVSGKDLGGEYI